MSNFNVTGNRVTIGCLQKTQIIVKTKNAIGKQKNQYFDIALTCHR